MSFDYMKLLDESDIGLCICSSRGEIKDINRSACEIWDIKYTSDKPTSLTGKNLHNIYADYKRIFERVNSDGSLKNFQYHLKTLGKNKKWISHNFIINSDKDLIYILFRDSTPENTAQDELSFSEKNLQSIISIIPDVVYRLDTDGCITFISDRITNYGYSPKELIGKNIMEIIHPDDRDRALYRVNERRTGRRKTTFFNIRIITRNKEDIPFEIEQCSVSASQLFTISAEGIYLQDSSDKKKFAGTQGIARDINRRKIRDLDLQYSLEKCYSVLNNLDDGYFETDTEGIIKFANRSLCRITGFKRDELIGQSCKMLIEESENCTLSDVFQNIEKTEKQIRTNEWTGIKKDDKKIQIESSVSLLKDKNGMPAGFHFIIRDLTARRKLEEELFRARKLEAIGIFSGGIAHDFNNALTAIIGNINIAKMEADPDNKALIEVLNEAEDASMRVKDLTRQLSSFSKGGKPVKKLSSVKKIVEETAETVLQNFDGKVEISIPDNLNDIEIDEFQISHVFEYIFLNSIDAIKDARRKGTISITAERVTIEEEESHHEITLQKGNYIKITIEDNGIGIDADTISDIFDPYYSTKELRSGMGLAISYAIIKRHSGYIDVASNPGEGTFFFVYLPESS